MDFESSQIQESSQEYLSTRVAIISTSLFLLGLSLAFVIKPAYVFFGAATAMITTNASIAVNWNKEFTQNDYANIATVKALLYSLVVFSACVLFFVYFGTPLSIIGSALSTVALTSLTAYTLFYLAVYQTTMDIELGTHPLKPDDNTVYIFKEHTYINALEQKSLEKQTE